VSRETDQGDRRGRQHEPDQLTGTPALPEHDPGSEYGARRIEAAQDDHDRQRGTGRRLQVAESGTTAEETGERTERETSDRKASASPRL